MHLDTILAKFKAIADTTLAEEVDLIDREGKWPEATMRRIQEEGLAGLVVPAESGGLAQGLYGLVKVGEILGQVSGSAALCFGMHCVGSAVIAAKATDKQKKQFLEPIARGEHLTTLALSEPGTGSHFYLPQTQLLSVSAEEFLVNGQKTFVTNGTHCDSYVISTAGVEAEASMQQFSCLVVEEGMGGMNWGPEWSGLGMRGNSSRTLSMKDMRVPADYLLGEKGDQLWYIFQVVAPYFLCSMSGTYLGLAQAALNAARTHMMERSHSHSGMSLSQQPLLQHRLGTIWAKVERTRQLLYHAARAGEAGSEDAVLALLSAKAEVGQCVVDTVNEAMTLMGGIAYRDNSRLDTLLRDARAAHIMAPTTDLLYTWIGRALLEQPLLND